MPDMQQLMREQASAMGVSPLPVVAESDGAASTDGSTVFYNPAFISDVESSGGEGAVRFILAHELGHAVHGMVGGHAGELQADEFAARSLAATGTARESIAGVMIHLGSEASESHPASSARSVVARSAYDQTMRTRQTEPQEKHASKSMSARSHGLDL